MKSVILLVIGVIVGAGANFLVQLYLAKALSVSDFGIFTSIINLVNLISPLIAFGVSNFMLRAYAEEGNDAKRWLASIVHLLILSSILAFFILQTWSYYKNGIQYYFIIYCLFYIYMLSISYNSFTRLKLQVEDNFSVLSVWQIIPNTLKLISVITIIYLLGSSIFNVALAYGISGLLVFIISVKSLYEMNQGKLKIENSNSNNNEYDKHNKSIMDLLRKSYPYGLSGIFYLIYYQSDILILTYYLDYTEVGYYGFSLVFITALCLLPSMYYQTFQMKKIHSLSDNNKVKLKSFYLEHNYYSLAIGILFFIIFNFCISYFILNFFGDKYSAAIIILHALSFYIPIKFITLNSDSIMSTKNLVNIKVKIMGVAAIINIGINFLLIPIFGTMGAVYSTIITELFLMILFFNVLNNKL